MKLPQLKKYLKTQNIDLVFLAHPDPNIIYFTQTIPSKGFLLITPRKANLYLTKLDLMPKIEKIKTRELSKEWTNITFVPSKIP